MTAVETGPRQFTAGIVFYPILFLNADCMLREEHKISPDPEKYGPRGKQSAGRKPGVNADNKESSRIEESPTNTEPDASNEPSGESRRPVTNHDEQEKIVNSDLQGNALGEKENEGV